MKIKIGDEASLTKQFTIEDIETFARIAGDENPLHLDQDFARNTVFGKRIAHGLLVAGLISAVIGNQMPGRGSVYLNQTLTFKKPVFPNDKITARVTVTNIKESKNIYTLATRCLNQNNETVIEGEAIIMLPA